MSSGRRHGTANRLRRRPRGARARMGADLRPALMLFVGVLVIVPLAMTVLLSFHDWGQYKGIEPVFTLKNWHEICVRLLLLSRCSARTFRIALLATLDHRRARRARGLHPQPHARAAGRASSCS